MNTVTCDMCEEQFTECESSVPDRGLEVVLVGGYGLFHDDIENKCEKAIVLCHACSLKLVRMIPKFANSQGWHSVSYRSPDYPLCCEYSWTIDKNVDEFGDKPIIYGTKENFKG